MRKYGKNETNRINRKITMKRKKIVKKRKINKRGHKMINDNK